MILNEIKLESFDLVPDPYNGGDSGFHITYNTLDKASNKIITHIE